MIVAINTYLLFVSIVVDPTGAIGGDKSLETKFYRPIACRKRKQGRCKNETLEKILLFFLFIRRKFIYGKVIKRFYS